MSGIDERVKKEKEIDYVRRMVVRWEAKRKELEEQLIILRGKEE